MLVPCLILKTERSAQKSNGRKYGSLCTIIVHGRQEQRNYIGLCGGKTSGAEGGGDGLRRLGNKADALCR